MAKITIEELSDSLKEYLGGLGLTEEQVNSLVQNKLGDLSNLETLHKDNIVDSVNEVKDTVAFVGTAIFGSDMSDDTLMTDSNTVIGAINELFQSANSGKQLIANAIGNESIDADSTFSAMSEAILELKKESENETDPKEVLYNMMIEDGYNKATSEMTVDELIDLLDRSGIDIGDIKQISFGMAHTMILKNDGSVWACGYNSDGQLGLGDTNDRKTFTQVADNVKQIACGANHIFIMKNDGSVWACGNNSDGQLGLNDTNNRATFTKVTTNVNNVKQIACGFAHTIILKNDGSLWSCGSNDLGQLGLGDTTTGRNTFTQVANDINNDVNEIVCGMLRSVIIKNDGSLWACGWNSHGELGLGDTIQRYTFTQVTTNVNNDVKQIACGANHTFIIKNDGSVWACGNNGSGQLGLNNTTDRTTFTQVTTNINNDVKQIECGGAHTMIIKNNGTIWSCGYNDYGQLGLGDTTKRATFTKVTTNINNDVKQISCGYDHTYILKNDGSLWSCGDNDYGQLGLGDTTDRNTFTNTNFYTSIPEDDIDRLALYNYLLLNNIPVTESMDIETMLNLLVNDNTNNTTLGYATGEGSVTFIITTESKPCNAHLDKPFGFTPTHIILVFDNGAILTNKTTSNNPLELNTENYVYIDSMTSDTLTFKSFSGMNQYSHDFTYYAFGIGEEKSSGKRSLYNELIDKGYEATESMSVEEMIDLLEDCNIDPNEIKQIACGDSYTFILKNDGSLWACGYNYGKLGLGDETNRTTFTQVTTNISNDVKQISCGNSHTFILKNDGSVWACGDNYNGQLGLGDTDDRNIFTQVTTNINNDVKQVFCGYYYTFIIKNDGSVWSCGCNEYGQLGLGDSTYGQLELGVITDRTTFTKVTTNINNDVKQIACGERHTVILKNDGSIWVCGCNYDGELGLGTTDTFIITTFTQATNISNVKQIACGGFHTFIIKNDGTVWSCGYNSYGQLGLGTSDTNAHSTFTKVTTNINNDVSQIACGRELTYILKNDGSIWSCGWNNGGQLGLGDTTDRTTFTQVTTNINNDIKQIACGSQYTIILKNDGSLWGCGWNSNGQLGLGDTTKRNTFTNAISIDTSPEYLNKLKLYQFLKNTMSLPVTGSMSIDELLDALVNKFELYSGMLFDVKDTLISLMQEGGYNVDGDEDISSLIRLLKLSGISVGDIKQIACGYSHTVILKNDGSIWTCGYNSNGQLGLGDTTQRTTFTKVTTNINNDVKKIVCGYGHTFILKRDGSIWACGSNNYGQLGLNNTIDQTTFTQVTTNISNVKQIACGSSHTVILKNDGSVWICGYNYYGQLGLGNNTNNQYIFTQVITNINNDVKQVACGQYQTFIIKNDGTVWSCGLNSNGQLGLNDTTNQTTFTQATNISNVKQIVCGGYHTVIVKKDGSLWSCGLNGNGQLGLGATSTNQTTFTQVTTNINNDVKQVFCGNYHTVILKNDGSIWVSGRNNNGQLGLGDTSNITSFTQVTTNVRQISCFSSFTFILKNDDTIWTCGYNGNGQLGLGDTTNRNTFIQVTSGF